MISKSGAEFADGLKFQKVEDYKSLDYYKLFTLTIVVRSSWSLLSWTSCRF